MEPRRKPKGKATQTTHPDKRSREADYSGIWTWLKGFVDWPKILASVGALVLAALGAILTPVGDKLYRFVYPENVEVTLNVDRSVLRPWEPVQITVTLRQLSPKTIDKGTVEVDFDSSFLTLAPNARSVIPTEEVAGLRVVTASTPIVLHPVPGAQGTTEITGRFYNRYGEFKSTPVQLQLVKAALGRQPFIERPGAKGFNLSGTWHIEIGATQGEMMIVQNEAQQVDGSYKLQEGKGHTQGTITGFKDGTGFRVFFIKADEKDHPMRVEANFEQNPSDPQFIEMKGCLYELQRDPSVKKERQGDPNDCSKPRDYIGWRYVSSSNFYATARLAK